ncbi:MAG: hypothetical protein D6715_08575 [Calditrichaeota bacterium]|nr:MAG: hypothetical protein D6715_08575 [Calditrichota bacterium]
MRVRGQLKILIYSQDGYGLGHLRRNVNIIHQLKKIYPSATVLIIVDSPVAPFFELPPQCDFIKIPTMVKVDYGVWQSNCLEMDCASLLSVRSELIQEIVLNYRPHIFLVDHMPQGALGELVDPIRMLKKYCPDTRLVLGLRDILGAPDAIRQVWTNEQAFEIAESNYDKILIYGTADVYDSLSEYAFPQALQAKSVYCGYVTRAEIPSSFMNEGMRCLLPDGRKPFVLVTGGGGKDAGAMMAAFVQAVAQFEGELPFDGMISTGPFLPEDQLRELQAQARKLGLKIADLGEDAIHFIARADLVVSMAGYNTISELLFLRKNALIVPRRGPSAEQTMRTQILARRGLFDWVHPDELSGEVMRQKISERLNHRTVPDDRDYPSLDGAIVAAREMLGLLD